MAAKLAYTAAQSAELVAAYVATPTAETVEAFAVKFAKTTKSIIAKLSREGCYQKKEYVSKTGEKPVKKDEIANEFQERFSLTEVEADSLTKANKTALAKILKAYSELRAVNNILLNTPAE